MAEPSAAVITDRWEGSWSWSELQIDTTSRIPRPDIHSVPDPGPKSDRFAQAFDNICQISITRPGYNGLTVIDR